MSADISFTDSRIQGVHIRQSIAIGDRSQVLDGQHPLDRQPRLAQLTSQLVFAALDGFLAALPGEVLLDLRDRPWAGDEAQPVAAGPGVLRPRNQDLADVAIAQLAAQRHQASVHPGADTSVADLGVNRVGQVDRCGVLRQCDDVTLGSEDVDLGGVELETQRFEELPRIVGLPLPLVDLLHPVQLGGVRVEIAAAVLAALAVGLFLVLPVRGHTVLGAPVHLVSADLELHRMVAGTQDRGVQRLVHVVLRHRDVILEPPGQRIPPGVQHAERAVTVAGGVDQHPQPDQIVDVGEVAATHHHLLVDRVVVLGTPVDRRLDAGLGQVLLGLIDHLTQLPLTLRRRLGDHPDDLVVDLRLQGGEREVLQLPLDRVHTQPVSQRREDLQGIPGDALLLVGTQIAEGTHVVQAVGQLDHEHPHIACGRDHELADRLCLGRLAVGELVELGDPVDQAGDLVAEVGAQLIEGVAGVLHRVVQQRSAQRGLGHAQFGENRGHRQRMGDVGLTALTDLAAMVVLRGVVGPLQLLEIGLGVIGLHHREQRIQHRRLGWTIGRPEPRQPLPHSQSGLFGATGDALQGGRAGGAGGSLAAAVGPVDAAFRHRSPSR